MFFGFTHCPEVCPTALFDISEILSKLGPDADKVNALFITVDPERDTPAVLKDYLSSFNPRLIGVGGDAEQLAAVAKAYRVYYKKVPLKDGDYTMDHTAIVYLMDKNGAFVAPFSLKRQPEEGRRICGAISDPCASISVKPERLPGATCARARARSSPSGRD